MSSKTKPKNRERMSQERLNSLINGPVKVEREHIDPKPVLVSDVEYDTLNPEEVIKNFCGSIRNMLSRYQYDKDQYSLLEHEMQDILHYIEMSSDKSANSGYKLYKKLAEIRRERRKCKNEIDLLQPVYDAFAVTTTLSYLSNVQGSCRTAKQTIENRGYTVRTDVLNPFIENKVEN